jgi:hypothetical protein
MIWLLSLLHYAFLALLLVLLVYTLGLIRRHLD